MNIKIITTILLLLLAILISNGQNNMNSNFNYPEGISMSYGYSNYSIKDNFISSERYSGTSGRFIGEWVIYIYYRLITWVQLTSVIITAPVMRQNLHYE